MPKQVSDSQDFGYLGESEFQSWATRIGWYPTKLQPDHGIDFVCQIRGDRLTRQSSEMPGKTLNVSVRSTHQDSDTIVIDRSDAELFLTTPNPTVLAIVRRAPQGHVGEVGIKFVDEQFVKDLDAFLTGKTKTHTVRFSDAVTDIEKIRYNTERLFKEPYSDAIARFRTEGRLKALGARPDVEIVHSSTGNFLLVGALGNEAAEICEKAQIADIVRPIDARIQFAPSSFIGNQQSKGTIGLQDGEFTAESGPSWMTTRGIQAAQRSFASNATSLETYKDGGNVFNVSQIVRGIERELSVWNYNEALVLASQIEQMLQDNAPESASVTPMQFFLLARVHVIRAERKDPGAKRHIQSAKSILTRIEAMPGALLDTEMESDIYALRASIENLEKGPDRALARLAERTDPYATRIRLAILLNRKDLDGSLRLVENLPPNERWCELAVTAFVLGGRSQDAEKLVQWAAARDDATKRAQCVVRFADAMLSRSLDGKKGRNVRPHELSEQEKGQLSEVLDALTPVLVPVLATKRIDSELDLIAVKIAFQVSHLIGKRKSVSELARLMYDRKPIPVEVARAVFSEYIDCPEDLPQRLRVEHPNDIEAGSLAAALQSSCLEQHGQAFNEARELIRFAHTQKEKDELFMLFLQIWQELEGQASADCAQVAASLVSHSPKLRALFRAAKALRVHKPDAAIRALEDAKADDDIWLQLKANALLQKHQPKSALDFLLRAVKRASHPSLLHRTADLALQVNKPEVAAWCYKQLIAIQPDSRFVRSNLASIYVHHYRDMSKALGQFEWLHKAEPENTAHAVNLALCLAQLYRPRESLTVYEEVFSQNKPDIRAALGRAELLANLGDGATALSSLQSVRSLFWTDQNFLLSFLNIAYAAGDEKAAFEAFEEINALREAGKVDSDAFRMIPENEGLEMLKQRMKQNQERFEYLHSEMLKGRMPWVLAECISSNAIYWGWRSRTQEMAWVGDDPKNRASFCIYSTNAFHPRKTKEGFFELLPVDCPPEGTSVVADISSLITLDRLGLLAAAGEYFGTIIVPEAYLGTVLDDNRKMLSYQYSREKSAQRLARMSDIGVIKVIEKGANDIQLAAVDQYAEKRDDCYDLIDLLSPVHGAGIISDATYDSVSKVAKKTNTNHSRPGLVRLQAVLVELSSLETVSEFELLDAISQFYQIYIRHEARDEIRQRIQHAAYQQETRRWNLDLWDSVKNDAHFSFVSHVLSKEIKKRDPNTREDLAFLASFVARESNMSLLIDDRSCQAFAFNERQDARYPAFGTDAVIGALLKSRKIETSKAAESLRQLMLWRYRFLLPTPGILKSLASQYRMNPPGRPLQDVADYVHDCMRDEGLFGGAEKTVHGESIAMRLYVSWLSVCSNFIYEVWDDESFSSETARRLTDWCVRELVPSLPRVVEGLVKVRMGSATQQALIAHLLIKASSLDEVKRIPDGIRALKDAMKLDDNDYLSVVTGIIDTAKDENPGSDEMRKMEQWMRIQMRKAALHRFEKVNVRTVRMLETLNLFHGKTSLPDVDVSALLDPHHPRREQLPPGPLVLYVTEHDPSLRMIVDLPMLLFADSLESRKAAIECLDQVIQYVLAITPKTRAILKANRELLMSGNHSEWRRAAVALSDSLVDDALFALMGTRQSLGCDPVHQDTLHFYASRVFHPTVSSVDSISLEISDPENEHAKISGIIDQLGTNSNSLKEVCKGYYEKLGYLPLAPKYGLARAVLDWLKAHPDANAWTEVWDWARGGFGPLPRYHACSVFISHPELIPTGKLPELWNTIVQIMQQPGGKQAKDDAQETWALRNDLARHYTFHFESRIPDGHGAHIACFAWWFSEKVATLFSDTPEAARFYRENWVKPGLRLSSLIWLTASARISRSFLRYVTLSAHSPWVAGLLSMMSDKLDQLRPAQQSSEIQDHFHEALVHYAIVSLPFSSQSPADPTFSPECSLASTVLRWAEYQPEESGNALKELVSKNKSLSTTEQVCEALRKLGAFSLNDQVMIAVVLKAKAYTDPTIAKSVGGIVLDPSWRIEVLSSIDGRVLGLLIEAFGILQAHNQEDWFLLLPHSIAELCEKTDDEERRRYLFWYLLYASFASNTVSAVRRLLRGDKRGRFVELANEYREEAERIRSDLPPWVAGKMRDLISSLRVL